MVTVSINGTIFGSPRQSRTRKWRDSKTALLWHASCYSLTRKVTTMKTIDQQIDGLVREWRNLLIALKPTIADDYRASDAPDDSTPGMCVTIGFTPATEDTDASWSYQTGDNSYTGGAYGHPHWAVVSLYRRSNCRELAKDIADQLGDLCAQ